MLSNRAEVLAQLPRSGAPPAFRSYEDWEEFVELFARLGHRGGLHALLVGHPPASALRDAGGPHAGPADGARAHGRARVRARRAVPGRSRPAAARMESGRREASTSRTAGRPRGSGSRRSSSTRTASARRRPASSPRSWSDEQMDVSTTGSRAPARGRALARAGGRLRGPRRADARLEAWPSRPRRSR